MYWPDRRYVGYISYVGYVGYMYVTGTLYITCNDFTRVTCNVPVTDVTDVTDTWLHGPDRASTWSWRGKPNNGWLPARILEHLSAQSRYFVMICNEYHYRCHASSRHGWRYVAHARSTRDRVRVGTAYQWATGAVVVHWEDMGRLPFPASSESPGRSATSWVTRAADQVSRAGRLRGYRQIHEARSCQRLGASFRCAWAPPSSRSYVMVSSLGRGQPPRDPHATMARGSDSMHPSCQRVTDVQARAHVALDARVLRE